MMASRSFQVFFTSRIGAILFLTGKVLRVFLFLMFLILLSSRTKLLAGYTMWEIVLFYLTFNLIDSATQTLFREVYRFRQYIVSGSFDLILLKPVNPLFRSLFGWTDILDLVTLVPFIVAIGVSFHNIPGITMAGFLGYILLVANALVIATACHIFVLALGVMTTEVDHMIMIYRDVTGMGRIPIDVYSEPIRGYITYVLPVGIMMSFPVQAVLGKLIPVAAVAAISISMTLIVLSILSWRFALRRYTSASS
jgi:ABC-2 type transport system permease protein